MQRTDKYLTKRGLPRARGAKLEWLRDHVNYEGDDCLKWPFLYRPDGYGDLGIRGRKHLASRYMLFLATGALSSGLEAAHSCGNGHLGCLNPKHLSWKNRQQNEDDKTAHGTRPVGEKNGSAKLSFADVANARRSVTNGVSISALARAHGVNQSVMSRAVRRITWKGVTEDNLPSPHPAAPDAPELPPEAA